jgi:hypothetical protein
MNSKNLRRRKIERFTLDWHMFITLNLEQIFGAQKTNFPPWSGSTKIHNNIALSDKFRSF